MKFRDFCRCAFLTANQLSASATSIKITSCIGSNRLAWTAWQHAACGGGKDQQSFQRSSALAYHCSMAAVPLFRQGCGNGLMTKCSGHSCGRRLTIQPSKASQQIQSGVCQPFRGLAEPLNQSAWHCIYALQPVVLMSEGVESW